MSHNLSVAILVPVYNGEKYLKRCLDTLIKQTYQNFFIVVINDGSSDKTKMILEDYKDLIIIHQENKGISKTRNKLLEYANSDLIWFVDSDDYVEVDTLEIMVNNLKENDLIITSAYFDFGEYKEIYNPFLFNGTFENNPEILKEPMYLWNKLYKTKIIKENNISFKEGYIYEDMFFNVLYMQKCQNIVSINIPLVYYNRHDESSTANLEVYFKEFPLAIYDIKVLLKNDHLEVLSFIFKEFYLDLLLNKKYSAVNNVLSDFQSNMKKLQFQKLKKYNFWFTKKRRFILFVLKIKYLNYVFIKLYQKIS